MGLITVTTIVIGLVLGLVTGGRFANAGLRPLRGVGALTSAVLLQVVPEIVDLSDGAGLACVLASYALLVAFALVNIRLVGMPVVLLGLAANALVIGVNSGMPVRADAIRTVDPSVELAEVDFGAKRHLEEPDDRLTFLGDILPAEPIGQVLSFGDLILALGVGDLVFRLLKPLGPIRRGRRLTMGEVMAMLPAVTVTEPKSA